MKKLTFSKFEKLEYTRAEQFNAISVNLDFCGDDIKKISITSTREDEGKSFVAMQLMRTFAINGKRVVLVDCDLRKSRLVRDYGITSTDDESINGLSHYLAGIATIGDVLYSTDIENADIIVAGKTVTNPMNLLKKPKFTELLDILSAKYDLVIVDTPPIQPVIDGAYVAQQCDGTVLVIRYGVASANEIRETKNQIVASHAQILGTVLNSVPHSSNKYYSKRYRYKYSRYYEYK